jgi:ketosteroid isomerase-like protein
VGASCATTFTLEGDWYNRWIVCKKHICCSIDAASGSRCDARWDRRRGEALFRKFITAQNAHDLKAVGEILLDSPQFFWITRNTPIWGRDPALKRFEENYKGTWLLEPKFDEVKVTELSSDVAQLFVPAVFTIAPAGQTAQPRNFLLTQIYLRTNSGWRLATILPFPVL